MFRIFGVDFHSISLFSFHKPSNSMDKWGEGFYSVDIDSAMTDLPHPHTCNMWLFPVEAGMSHLQPWAVSTLSFLFLLSQIKMFKLKLLFQIIDVYWFDFRLSQFEESEYYWKGSRENSFHVSSLHHGLVDSHVYFSVEINVWVVYVN